jgi:hypothetical protein
MKVRCKVCNREIESYLSKPISCGCQNMTTIIQDKITAVDLSKVVLVNLPETSKKGGVLTNEDLAFQESRRQRRVKKLDFEVR